MLWFRTRKIYDEAVKCPPVILGDEGETPLYLGSGADPYADDWVECVPAEQPDGACLLCPANWSESKEAEFAAVFADEIASGDIALSVPLAEMVTLGFIADGDVSFVTPDEVERVEVEA